MLSLLAETLFIATRTNGLDTWSKDDLAARKRQKGAPQATTWLW